MSDSLIEQVRTLVQSTRPLCNPNIAHADEDGDTTCRHCGIGMYCGEERHCSSQKSPYDALLAHMQAQQERVELLEAVVEVDNEILVNHQTRRVHGDSQILVGQAVGLANRRILLRRELAALQPKEPPCQTA